MYLDRVSPHKAVAVIVAVDLKARSFKKGNRGRHVASRQNWGSRSFVRLVSGVDFIFSLALGLSRLQSSVVQVGHRGRMASHRGGNAVCSRRDLRNRVQCLRHRF